MTAREWSLIACAPVIYFALLALGRWLKRRWSVRLGFFYHLFCLCAALFVPMPFLNVPGFLVRAFGALVTLLATLFVLALLQRGVWEIHFGEKQRTHAPKFVGEVFNLVIFLVVLVAVLNGFYSIQIPHLIAGSGILAVILGLAMQDTLGNILAGFALHFEKPFRAGDWLIVDNRQAQVMELNWRATRLRTNDDVYLDIPNSQLAKATIVNLSYPTASHAMRLRLGLEYSTPPNDARDALWHATASVPGVLKEPAPKVFVVEFGDAGLVYEVKYWLNDHAHFNEISDAVRTNIWYELNRRGMRIPFPGRDVQMLPVRVGDDGQRMKLSARDILRARSPFRCFSDAQIEELLAAARRARYGRGETVIEQGQDGDSMFVLLAGGADVLITMNGHTTRVAGLTAGDCFGEMSLLSGEPRSATVVAQSDCDVVEIGKANMAEMLQRSPELLQRLSETLARRRIENEGALADSEQARALADTQKRYAATFLTRLKSFFEL